MTSVQQRSWTSWHLHLPSDRGDLQDQVVARVIAPVVRQSPATGWFFIRYWQAGPHLRLRMADLSERQADSVEDQLAESMAPFCQEGPEGRAAADEKYLIHARGMAAAGEEGASVEAEPLLPPGVHRKPYQPETERYGGPSEIGPAERLFQYSSEAVAALIGLADGPRLPPDTRLRAALQASAVALAALPDDGRRAAFCAHGVDSWERWLRASGAPQEQVDSLHAESLRLADQLRGAVGALLRGPAAGPVRRWADGLAETVTRLSGGLGVRPEAVLFSHIHMFHNRLGTAVRVELLCYAILQQLIAPIQQERR
ncbi:thiopeptide-type bacteriocin biosynthesis protein [Kitasatospora sp. SUK 42]|uniref:thiopeptide-type bacteriocin biosynthesis protein n=1 Tax=Kitasatospora sp. SUK 42 TaxID=1588882 RepID=UPI0018C91B21|nr:thiopeptide-type bacteriocin biosynthesis protein [Kitasatospora sp. SUK 42]MBV2153686.1 thiopeptide-type bacteriocin biosynthesis protein [Kitasatospora sp. SUK 42]